MEDDSFEWDDAKAAANSAFHRVDFATARRVFDDPFAIEREDNRFRYDEKRFNIIGMVEGRLLFVAYTLRDDKIRILSARGAEPRERRRYHEESR